MKLSLTVVAKDEVTEEVWARELRPAISQIAKAEVLSKTASKGSLGQLILVDGTEEGETVSPELKRRIDGLDRNGRAVFLIVRDGLKKCEALETGLVDDILTYPFRLLEVLSRFRHFQQILMWDEVKRLNSSFSQIISEIRDDLSLAERMQKAKLPIRFPDVKGFKITHRTLIGWRSGDYADLAESRDGSQLSLFFSDASTSRLSSAVLNVLMRVAVKLSSDEARSTLETVRRIHEELLLTLGEKDKLALFYGAISRKDYRLRYVNFGTTAAFRAPKGAPFEALPAHGDVITSASGFPPGGGGIVQAEVDLEPQDRLVFLSDGFVEIVGGASQTAKLLNQFREKEPTDLLNELVYRVKSSLTAEEELPPQDCTAVIFDVADRLIRLAK